MTEAAKTDLAEIWACIAFEACADVATHFVKQLAAAFEPIRSCLLALPRHEQLVSGLHVTDHHPYAIECRP